MLFFSNLIADFCVCQNLSNDILVVHLELGMHQHNQKPILLILCSPAFFRISTSSKEHHFLGVKPNSSGADLIIQSISLRVGSWVQHLWCTLLGTPDNTPVLSFCFLHDALLVAGVGIQLMGPLSLSDCGWTIDSRSDTAKGSASSWGTKEPSRTPRQFSSLSAHGPKASKRAGCRKAVPTVLD